MYPPPAVRAIESCVYKHLGFYEIIHHRKPKQNDRLKMTNQPN